jgi:hypothetical protein
MQGPRIVTRGGKGKERAKTLAIPSSPSPSDEAAMAAGGTADFFYRESQRLGYVARSAFKVSSRFHPGSLLAVGCCYLFPFHDSEQLLRRCS